MNNPRSENAENPTSQPLAWGESLLPDRIRTIYVGMNPVWPMLKKLIQSSTSVDVPAESDGDLIVNDEFQFVKLKAIFEAAGFYVVPLPRPDGDDSGRLVIDNSDAETEFILMHRKAVGEWSKR